MKDKKEVRAAILCDWEKYSDYHKQSNKYIFELTHSGARLTRMKRWLEYHQSKKHQIRAILYRLLYHRVCMKCGCDIPSRVEIGVGLCLPHAHGIVIHSKTKIGSNVTILGNVVLGHTAKGEPTIGNNVYIGANAVVIGPVILKDGCVVGAGAVVTHDVEENTTVVGNPAKPLCED